MLRSLPGFSLALMAAPSLNSAPVKLTPPQFQGPRWQRSPLNGRLVSTAPLILEKPAQPDYWVPLDPERHQIVRPTSKREWDDHVEEPSIRLLRPFRKLMSYNAENFYRTSKHKSVKPRECVEALAEVIKREDPDVIAFQEVGDKGFLNQFNQKYLDRKYPNIVSNPVWGSSLQQLAILSKGNLRVVDSKNHGKDYQDLSNGAAVRNLLEATFETETGYRFTVFTAHYRSMKKGEAETAAGRLKEAKATSHIIKNWMKENPGGDAFFTGDLNTKHSTVFGKPVIETLERLDDVNGEPQLVEVMLKDQKLQPTNRSLHYPDVKLDYTFASKSLSERVRDAYVAGQFDQEPWHNASDHLPLVTVFEEGKPPGDQRFALPFELDSLPLPVLESTHPMHTRKKAKKRKLELIA